MKSALAFALLALAAPLSAQRTPVSEAVEQAADGTHRLSHEVIVDADPDAVWTAVSTPEGWRTWAVPVAWVPDGEPDILETNYMPDARPNDPSTIRQQILERVPGRRLVFRTVKAPEGFPDFDTYRQVMNVFELSPAGPGRTRLRLTASNYPDSEAGRRLLGFFRDGNRVTLERLRDRFAD